MPVSSTRTIRNTPIFSELLFEILSGGNRVRFRANGASMAPAIFDGEAIHIAPVTPPEIRRGDILLTRGTTGFNAHRLLRFDGEGNLYLTRGDAASLDDLPVGAEQIAGKVVAVERFGHLVRIARGLVGHTRRFRRALVGRSRQFLFNRRA